MRKPSRLPHSLSHFPFHLRRRRRFAVPWTARACPSFHSGRHVAASQGCDVSQQSSAVRAAGGIRCPLIERLPASLQDAFLTCYRFPELKLPALCFCAFGTLRALISQLLFRQGRQVIRRVALEALKGLRHRARGFITPGIVHTFSSASWRDAGNRTASFRGHCR